MKTSIRNLLILVSFIFLLTSCASTPKTPKILTQAQQNNIKKIGLAVTQASEDMEVINHIKGIPATYTGYQLGALAALVDIIIISAQTNAISKKSLGGDSDILKQNLAGYTLTDKMQDSINTRLSKKYEVIPVDTTSTPNGQSDNSHIDALLKIKYIYGLAVYEDDNASPAIIADLTVSDIKTDSILMKKRISSDAYYRDHDVVQEFAKNDAKLFKSDMKAAVKVTAIAIGDEFGIEDENDLLQQNFMQSMDITKIECDDPYQLTQNCTNFSGATLKIEINGVKAKIAGSSDGEIVFLMIDNFFSASLIDAFTLGITRKRAEASKRCFQAVTFVLSNNGIQIIKPTRLVLSGGTVGYFFVLSDDGYSILKRYSK